MDSSIKCKSKFKHEIKEFANLIPVDSFKWAGVGSVRYIPDYLMDKLDEINGYVRYRDTPKTTNSDSELELIDLHNETSSTEPSLSEKWIIEINEINRELIRKLQSRDNAFAIGEDRHRMLFIKFGMVNEIEAVRKLAAEVQVLGREIQENSKFLEKMNDLVRQGIEKANLDLKLAKEKISNQEVNFIYFF